MIVVGFLFFQALVFESEWKLRLLAVAFGVVSFGLFGYSLRTFDFKKLGVNKEDWKKQTLFGVLLGFCLYTAFTVFRIFSSRNFTFLPSTTVLASIPLVFVIVLSEEFFFRGYAITMLEGEAGILASCIFSSALFALYHQPAFLTSLIGLQGASFNLDYENMFLMFCGGLLLSVLFVKKRSLILPTSLHLTWNFLILLEV